MYQKREIRQQTFPFRFGENAPIEWCDSFKTKLQSFGDVFIRSEFDIGKVDAGVEFDIEVEPGPQTKHRANRSLRETLKTVEDTYRVCWTQR